MSNIRIYSKAAFAIGEGATRDGNIDQFVTVPRSFQDMPEKYVTDATYLAAVKAGMIIPYSNAAPVIPVIPVIPVTPVEEDKFEDEEADKIKAQIDAFKAELKTKNYDEVKKLAEEYGAEFIDSDKLGENKKRVFEAFKLTLTSEQ